MATDGNKLAAFVVDGREAERRILAHRSVSGAVLTPAEEARLFELEEELTALLAATEPAVSAAFETSKRHY